MYTTILFDFFDVIHADPFKAWLKKHGISDTTPYFKVMESLDLGQISVADTLRKYEEISGVPYEEIVKDFAHKPLLDQRTPNLIKRLGDRYKLALLSNAAAEEIGPVLDEFGYRELFKYVFISGEVGLIKPSREAFEHVLEKLNSKPEETIFVDDSPKNVEAANQLGITSLQFVNYDSLEKELNSLGINLQ